jgi:hypothetical protein
VEARIDDLGVENYQSSDVGERERERERESSFVDVVGRAFGDKSLVW